MKSPGPTAGVPPPPTRIRAHIQRCWLALPTARSGRAPATPGPRRGHELDRMHLITLTTDAPQDSTLHAQSAACSTVAGVGSWPVVAAGDALRPSGGFGIDVMLILFDTFTWVSPYVRRGL